MAKTKQKVVKRRPGSAGRDFRRELATVIIWVMAVAIVLIIASS